MLCLTRARAQIASDYSRLVIRATAVGRHCARGPSVRNPNALHRWLGPCVLVLMCCTSGTGCCRLMSLANRTTRIEPKQYSSRRDAKYSRELYSQWADEEWYKRFGACSETIVSSDYAYGFHDGFVDYVYAGGSGEPPPVPPRTYWNVSFRNAEGRERVNQWFEGYREGALVAREGGYREMATVQSFGSVGERYDRLEVPRRGMDYIEASGAAELAPSVESLPAPSRSMREDEQDTSPGAGASELAPPELTMPSDETPADESLPSAPDENSVVEPPATSGSTPKQTTQAHLAAMTNPFTNSRSVGEPQLSTTPSQNGADADLLRCSVETPAESEIDGEDSSCTTPSTPANEDAATATRCVNDNKTTIRFKH